MKTYEGFDQNMRKIDSLAARPREYKSALEENVDQEASPYLHQTAISQGTLRTNLGGRFEAYDMSGGTLLFTIDPETGVVTIAGSISAGVSLNLGTIVNTVIAGASTLAGTLTNQRLIQNGTWNNGTLGTPIMTGGTATNMVLETPTVNGTPNFDVNAGSPALGINGDMAIQMHSGSAILAVRASGTTFYFTSAGTL